MKTRIIDDDGEIRYEETDLEWIDNSLAAATIEVICNKYGIGPKGLRRSYRGVDRSKSLAAKIEICKTLKTYNYKNNDIAAILMMRSDKAAHYANIDNTYIVQRTNGEFDRNIKDPRLAHLAELLNDGWCLSAAGYEAGFGAQRSAGHAVKELLERQGGREVFIEKHLRA